MSIEPNEAAPPARMGLIARLIDFSARRRFIVFLIAAALSVWGIWSAQHAQLDALPDLSDTQVIVATEWMGRSPTLIENQVTYPIATVFLGAPEIKTVRGFTMFGMSFVYVVFKDGTDLYWARSRVVEYLAKVKDKLPEGVNPQIGPDATSVGLVFQYALVDESGQQNLQTLRSFQDWHLRYWLQGLEGVAEVAAVGGYEKEYQIQVDPTRLKARNVSVGQIAAAVRGANAEVGGRVMEMSQHEYALRGRGYVENKEQLELAVVATDSRGTPIRIGDVADVTIGGNIRRGLVDLDGRGEVVGGVVIMRSGENALNVIARVKAKLEEVKGSMPPGVKIVPVYDRSHLINDSVQTLSVNLLQILSGDPRYFRVSVSLSVGLDCCGCAAGGDCGDVHCFLLPRRVHQHHVLGRRDPGSRGYGRLRLRAGRERSSEDCRCRAAGQHDLAQRDRDRFGLRARSIHVRRVARAHDRVPASVCAARRRRAAVSPARAR